MDCERVQELLPFYTRADLPDEEHRAVAQHLAGCSSCRREIAQVQHVDRLVREYLAAVPVPDVSEMKEAGLSRISQPRLQPALARPVAIGLLVLALLAGLVATAVAVYQRIVVVETSRKVPSLEEAVQRAGFPIWVSDTGELWRVSELDEGRHYTVFLDYRLDDGRRFAISETFAPYHAHQWEEDQVIEWDVDVYGQPAVLYRLQVTHPNGQTEWGNLSLHWHATGTSLTLSPTFQSTFTRDELIAIARSLRRVEQPGRPASALEEIRKQVTYPLFLPDGLPEGAELTWVYSMEFEGVPPVTFLWYTLADGREFYVSEMATQGHRDDWDRVQVLRRLEIHGQPAVLHVPSSGGDGGRRLPAELALHWHEEGTAISIVGPLTQEEIVAIARSITFRAQPTRRSSVRGLRIGP